MNFQPKTEKQIADGEMWKPGVYQFEVIDAQDKISSTSGNEMIVLRLRLKDQAKFRMVTDYLVAQRPRKLRNAALACGLGEQYDSGEFSAEHFMGSTGRLKLVIERAKAGYPRHNAVVDYLVG